MQFHQFLKGGHRAPLAATQNASLHLPPSSPASLPLSILPQGTPSPIQCFVLFGCTSWEVQAAAAKSLQKCPTLCDPIDGSPPGSPIPGILQARTLEWVAISFSNA